MIVICVLLTIFEKIKEKLRSSCGISHKILNKKNWSNFIKAKCLVCIIWWDILLVIFEKKLSTIYSAFYLFYLYMTNLYLNLNYKNQIQFIWYRMSWIQKMILLAAKNDTYFLYKFSNIVRFVIFTTKFSFYMLKNKVTI